MRDITPLHLNPGAIPEPWKRQPLTEPSFVHPLAIAGYKAYPSVNQFAGDIKRVFRELHRQRQVALNHGDNQHADDLAEVIREYAAWAEQEGLI